MAQQTRFVIGNSCVIDKSTARADEGMFAVVVAVDNEMENNKATVWIVKDDDARDTLARHLVASALSNDRMSDEDLTRFIGERRHKLLDQCSKHSFNTSFSTSYRELFSAFTPPPPPDPLLRKELVVPRMLVMMEGGNATEPCAEGQLVSVYEQVGSSMYKCVLASRGEGDEHATIDVTQWVILTVDDVKKRVQQMADRPVPVVVDVSLRSMFVFSLVGALPSSVRLGEHQIDIRHA